MYRRKRKASDDGDGGEIEGDRHESPDSGGATGGAAGGYGEDRMSASPSNSPAISVRPYPPRPMHSTHPRNKRVKSNIAGRPLAVRRRLEMLDAPALRSIVQSLSDRHPEINPEIIGLAAPPTIDAALGVLGKYESSLREAFPYGGNTGSDYAYNRVRQALTDLLDSLGDFTPHFLPPNETHMTTSLAFLDGATAIIHRLPAWSNPAHHHHKDFAYEEMSKAWALVIREAAKRGAGIQLQYGWWDQKLAKHNEVAHGRMNLAVNELSRSLDWMGGAGPNMAGGGGDNDGSDGHTDDLASIRHQLQSGTFGSPMPVHVGPW